TVDDLPLVFADSDGIQQIVLNLITNALSATASGGCIVVAIVPIIIQNKAVSDGVQLTIRDNGCGIPPDVLQHVFEPFFTTRHQQGGVGLGLAVARSIVIAHNGTIKAERSPGLGSTISIFLPAKERQHAID
ncbi:MAG: ATP-binding protein, partial [Methylobacter sp.]